MNFTTILKYISFRFLLHTLYFILAAAAGLWGIFYVGVATIGDNPGAVAAGILPFFATYYTCVVAESVLAKWDWRSLSAKAAKNKNSAETLKSAAVSGLIQNVLIQLMASSVAFIFAFFVLTFLFRQFQIRPLVPITLLFFFLLMEAFVRLALSRATQRRLGRSV